MRQLTLNFSTGEISVLEVPTPKIQKGCLLIRTRCSLISSGTERTLYNFSKSNILEKAKNQPDRVKEVLDKIKSDGIIPTYVKNFSRVIFPYRFPFFIKNINS